MKPNNEFGKRLKVAFCNATNDVIGEKLGISGNTVGFYVRGRVPDWEILVKISEVTNCNIHWLITGEGSRFVVFDNMFDLERSIERTDDWNQVLKDWYEFEGGEMPEDLAASFMGGWTTFTKQQKIDAIKDLKKILDQTISNES